MRVLVIFLTLVGVAGAASPGERLLEIYRQRCQTEIRTLAEGLDAREKRHPAPAEGEDAAALGKRIEAAWNDGPGARSEYRALLEATRKYTRWSREAKLPPGFETPPRMVEEATRARRWNGLRAVILPMEVEGLEPGERLGWNEPAGDPAAWQSEEARLVEWLLLLRWLGEPPADVARIDREWVRMEAGAPFLERWRKSDPLLLDFFHGDYRYEALRPPADPENAPLRVRHALARMASAVASPVALPRIGGPAHAVPMRDRVRRKEALLALLLAEVRRAKDPDAISAEWFRCGARVFPFLTALVPEGIEPVRAMRARPGAGDPLARVVDDEMLAPAVFRYQLELRGDGTWEAPAAGWSTGTPVTRAGRRDEDHVPLRTAPVAPAPGPKPKLDPFDRSRLLAPANAWSSICQWVVQELEKQGGDAATSYLLRKAEHRGNGWYLAFGHEELAEAIAKRWSPDAGAPQPVDVEILQVDPHRAVLLRLIAGREEVARQEFRIAGPWPGWFAARHRPAIDGQLLFPAFCLLLGVLVFVRGWRRRRDAPEAIGLIVMLVTPLVVWLSSGTLAPRTVGERGGTVEFALPADASVPAKIRELGRLVAAHVFLRLCRESDPAATPDEPVDDPFLARLGEVMRRVLGPWPLLPRTDTARVSEETSLMDMEYRIAGYAHGRESVRRGPLDVAHLVSFKRALAGMEHRGEKSVPPSLDARELKPASLVVMVADGDHGALLPPRFPAEVPAIPLVVLCPTGPGRDGRVERGLGAKARLEWLSARASETYALEPGGELRLAADALKDGAALARADASASEAKDLEPVRELWWARLDRDRMSAVAKRFADLAVARFRSSRTHSSRTVLAMTFVTWKLALLLVATVLAVIFPLWLRKVGLRDRGGILRFAASLATMGALLFASLSLMGLQGAMRSYGIETTEALRCGTWWCMIGLMVGLSVSLVFMLLAGASPYTRLIRGADRTWSVTPVPDRLQPWIHAAGLILVGTGVAWTLVCPAAHVGLDTRLIPRDLWASGLWGVGLFMLGTALLWHEPRALRPRPPKEGPPDAFPR